MIKHLVSNCKKNTWKTLVTFFCLCICFVFVIGGKAEAATTCSSGVSFPATTVSKVNLRKKAGTVYKSYGMLSKNQKVTVLGYVKNGGVKWYKCKAKINEKNKTGYVSAAYIKTPFPATGTVNKKVDTYLNVRKKAKKTSSSLMKIKQGDQASILGITSKSGKFWYKIKVSSDGKTKTGYVLGKYLDILDPEKVDDDSEQPDTPMTEEEFQTLLQAFPESYKTSLSVLHQTYPQWKFVAINTNLDWNTVIQNESVVGRNVIQSNYPAGTATLAPFSYLSTAAGAYDWSKDKYTVKDGSNWYSADPQVISYYMDPRNFLNDTDIFQFEALAYDSSHNENVVQSILNNTFMQGSYSVVDSATNTVATGTYKQAFMDAGKGALANPYFLASRVKQEVGVNGSSSTSGTYSGYEGIYNFYNIGANDGANAVANGLKWAKTGTTYERPWTTPYKSIVGGAKYIAANYINKGQNTLYFQKFNVASTDLLNAPLYCHQYMTNVQAPHLEGMTTRNAYSSLNILNNAMVFYIPVYNNMPAAPCALPASTGNPNPYISSLAVYNGTDIYSPLLLTPTFAYDQFVYTMAVESWVSQVTVSAVPVSGYATVYGTGTINLNAPGLTTSVVVIGQAQNGTQQQYVINIVRKAQ